MELYDVIYKRRDVRHFSTTPVSDAALYRLLDAAHHAGSVGFMQPWNFIVIRDPIVQEKVHHVFEEENAKAATIYSGERATLYRSMKLAGLREAPVHIAVTCNRERGGSQVLGRQTIRDVDIYSTCCAIQNLWLAATAEGLGIGWVSILREDAIRDLLKLPLEVQLVGYLCLGVPSEDYGMPMLEKLGWEKRLPLQEVVFADQWGKKVDLPIDAP